MLGTFSAGIDLPATSKQATGLISQGLLAMSQSKLADLLATSQAGQSNMLINLIDLAGGQEFRRCVVHTKSYPEFYNYV